MPEAIRLPGYSSTYRSYLSTAMSVKTIAGISGIPDTPLISAAIALAREHLADFAFNHIMRSLLLGFAISDRIPEMAGRDRELCAVAAVLHDLGWDEKGTFVSTDKCFEVDGANAARGFLEQHTDWDEHRKQLLWDAIALHTYPPVAMHKQPEVKATALGILAEFVGPAGVPGGALTTTEWDNISKEYPRRGFKDGVIQKMCGFCTSKPEATYLTFIGDFGEELVEGYTRKGHRPFDMIMRTVDAD